jgi:hypothetical protein
VRERRPRKRRGRGRKGEHPREVKTQERIGSNRRGNTRRMDARIPTWLNPLKASPGPWCIPPGPEDPRVLSEREGALRRQGGLRTARPKQGRHRGRADEAWGRPGKDRKRGTPTSLG